MEKGLLPLQVLIFSSQFLSFLTPVLKLEKDFPVSKYVIRMYREVMMNMDFKYWTEKQKSTQLYHEYLNKNQEYSAVSGTC